MIALLALFAVLAAAESNLWYYAHNLSEEHVNTLLEKSCFRGTYGAKRLSLFTCEIEGLLGNPLAELTSSHLLCYVEATPGLQADALSIAHAADDATLLWEGSDEFVLAAFNASSEDYPSVCVSRSDYNGKALNVITIPSKPIVPLQGEESAEVGGVPNDIISDTIAKVSQSSLTNWVNKLVSYVTRHSQSANGTAAADWAASQFQAYGFTVTKFPFRSGYCPDIIAEKKGTTTPADIVVIGSHLDSRGANLNSATAAAPGADDNGSGVAFNLEFARLIFTGGLRFANTIRLVTFCGEEQGLVGSRALAEEYKRLKENIIVMYNADMIGYKCSNYPITVTFDTGAVNPTAVTTCKNVVRTYLPSQAIGDNSGCCSDNQSFYENGFSAVSFFECPGTTVAYPYYHTAQDTADRLNYQQLTIFTQAAIACAMSSAKPA